MDPTPQLSWAQLANGQQQRETARNAGTEVTQRLYPLEHDSWQHCSRHMRKQHPARNLATNARRPCWQMREGAATPHLSGWCRRQRRGRNGNGRPNEIVSLWVPPPAFGVDPRLTSAIFAVSVTATGFAGCRLRVYGATTCKFFQPCCLARLQGNPKDRLAHGCRVRESRLHNLRPMSIHLLGLFFYFQRIYHSAAKATGPSWMSFLTSIFSRHRNS